MSDALEAELGQIRARARKRTIVVAGTILAAMALVGAVPALLGYGPFASRLLFGGRVAVHLLNASDHDLVVSMPFVAPTEVKAGHMETVQTLRGPFELVARDASGQVVERLEGDAERPMVVNLLGATCLAVFDLTGFYGSDDRTVSVVTTLAGDVRLYEIEADAVVLPRRPPLDRAAGTVHWIELIDCASVGEDNRDDLAAWGEFRIMQRYNELQEARARAAEAAGR